MDEEKNGEKCGKKNPCFSLTSSGSSEESLSVPPAGLQKLLDQYLTFLKQTSCFKTNIWQKYQDVSAKICGNGEDLGLILRCR